jgi:hypothetical protein
LNIFRANFRGVNNFLHRFANQLIRVLFIDDIFVDQNREDIQKKEAGFDKLNTVLTVNLLLDSQQLNR